MKFQFLIKVTAALSATLISAAPTQAKAETEEHPIVAGLGGGVYIPLVRPNNGPEMFVSATISHKFFTPFFHLGGSFDANQDHVGLGFMARGVIRLGPILLLPEAVFGPSIKAFEGAGVYARYGGAIGFPIDIKVTRARLMPYVGFSGFNQWTTHGDSHGIAPVVGIGFATR